MKWRFGAKERIPLIALQGGLGNQLFQWFYAHSVLESKEFRLLPIFPAEHKVNPARKMEVDSLILGCKHMQNVVESRRIFASRSFLPMVFSYLWRFSFLSPLLHSLGYFREDPRSDTRSHANPPNKIKFAEGYFLNWKHPLSQLDVVSLELLPVLSKVFESLIPKFGLNLPYNVIHVRNWIAQVGQDPRTTMGTLSQDYYVQWLRDHPSDRLIILTENRSEIEDLISATQPFLVLDQSTTNAWETLAIMSQAEFILGSNSTLSWWGVWTASLFGGKCYLPAEFDETPNRFTNSNFLFPSCNSVSPIWKTPRIA
jgi:hypothetical protein